MPTPTQINTDDITDLKNSNQRIIDTLHSLELTISRNHTEVMKRIDLVEAKVDTYAGLIKWSVTLAVPIIVAILGSIGVGIWYAAKLDSRVGHVEQIQAKAPK